MSRFYYLHSLGCKVNAYETTSAGMVLSSHGFSETHDVSEAEIIVLNTCSVTARADQKSRQHISSFRKRNPSAILVVMGCYSQTHAEEAISLGADIVLGAANRSEIYAHIKAFQAERKPIIDIKANIRSETYEELGTVAFSEAARAYLKIQDGCDNFCSYCFIPFLRGNSRSRDPREVINEAKSLVEQGYKEIIITGIHIGAYGKDLGDGSYRLSDLLESLLTKCPTLFRLRISSIEESEIDEKFLSLLKRYPAIVDHLHIPLQSGSEDVLKMMKRKYDISSFLAKLDAIRAVRPDIAITTDVIAGYPGETDEMWRESVSLCEKANFAEIHVFPFSSRPGTYAARLKDTDPKVKKLRVKELLELSKKMRLAYEGKFYGKDMEVLFEDYSEETHLASGHTANYLRVSVPSDKPRHGEVAFVKYNSQVASD